MKEVKEYEKDLASIRSIMERSVKFISLSGLSGILSGVFALLGSAAAYYIIFYPSSLLNLQPNSNDDQASIFTLLTIALSVFILSIGTGCWLSWRKAKKINAKSTPFHSAKMIL